MKRDRIEAAALTAAQLAGCTCDPEVTTTETCPGLWSATVHHDQTCELHARLVAPWN
jgi:hypothetical protein